MSRAGTLGVGSPPRAAPLGRDVPAGVVHAIFYNFAPGEAARHIPRVWDLITPEAALAARDRGCVVALRRMLGDLADNPSVARAADLTVKAAIWHLPHAQLAAVVDGMRDRGLIGADGWLTADGRATKAWIEALTDDLAAPAYDALEPSELAQLIADLGPIAAALNAAYDAEG